MRVEHNDDARYFDWLAGLIDGEGSFTIQRTGAGKAAFRLRFVLGLRADDVDVLREAQVRTGLGRLEWVRLRGRNNPQVKWEVARKDDVAELIELLNAHPLRSKKARDFVYWCQAFEVWETAVRGHWRADWAAVAAIKERMERERRYTLPATGEAVHNLAMLRCDTCRRRYGVRVSPGNYPKTCPQCWAETVLPLPRGVEPFGTKSDPMVDSGES